MKPKKLADILKKMYRDAKPGEKALSTHLFGIRYARDIRASGAKVNEIVRLSGIKKYETEFNKGMKLSEHVVAFDDVPDRLRRKPYQVSKP